LDDYDFDLDDPDDLDLRKRRTYRHPRTLWASRELVGMREFLIIKISCLFGL
jgi:hypothetical protein